jgi:processed acidic surface protein
MKKLGAILLSLSLVFGLFPKDIFAAQNRQFEKDFAEYLAQISEVRGFEVTKDDIEASLAAYELTINDFDSVEELSDFLGEVIKADLSNLDSIYEEYELDEASLVQLLKEHGEELNDYVFLDDLYEALYTYTDDGEFERDPNFEQKLSEYLTEISAIRGFEVTKNDIEKSLALYGESLENFETVEDLSDYLGDVIKADLSNLDYFEENFGMDKQSILDLLKENGKDINDYIFIDNLEQDIWNYSDGMLPGIEEEVVKELLPIFEEELGLTQEELQRIEDHLMSLEEHLSNPETLERLDQLANRMMAFEEFDAATELTPEQIAEIASIYEELLSIFKLKATYSLVKDGSETPLSLADLFQIEELKGANLKVFLYSEDGKFLADLIVTGEMVDSDTVIDTGEQIDESTKEAKETIKQVTIAKPEKQKPVLKTDTAEKRKVIAQKNDKYKTVKGAKLPKTASDYIPNALFGLFIALAGVLIYRKVRSA